MNQFVGHAPRPPHLCRNQVPYDLELDSGNQVPESPMMRGECSTASLVAIIAPTSPPPSPESNPLSLIPKPYRQVEIKYSKLGKVQQCSSWWK